MADNYVPMPVFMKTGDQASPSPKQSPSTGSTPMLPIRVMKPHEAVEMIDKVLKGDKEQ